MYCFFLEDYNKIQDTYVLITNKYLVSSQVSSSKLGCQVEYHSCTRRECRGKKHVLTRLSRVRVRVLDVAKAGANTLNLDGRNPKPEYVRKYSTCTVKHVHVIAS